MSLQPIQYLEALARHLISNVVLGRQSNGNIEWVNEHGKNYKERQNEIYRDNI
jgi:hypothetical protein